MIKINISYQTNFISSIAITGHAEYADYGKDIVCASVSSIAITSCNAIQSLYSDAIATKSSAGNLNIIVKDNRDEVQKLLQNMLNMFTELANDYPKNIKIGGLK